jgi:hypothetical protein
MTSNTRYDPVVKLSQILLTSGLVSSIVRWTEQSFVFDLIFGGCATYPSVRLPTRSASVFLVRKERFQLEDGSAESENRRSKLCRATSS